MPISLELVNYFSATILNVIERKIVDDEATAKETTNERRHWQSRSGIRSTTHARTHVSTPLMK